MEYADMIANEVRTLPEKKQCEILNLIASLKARQLPDVPVQTCKTAEEIESFFRSFHVDVSGYHFDRWDANAR